MQQSIAAQPGLSVFFPAYNDSGTIASLVISAIQTARKLTHDVEVIVVDDGSVDATADIVDELSRSYPEVKVVHHYHRAFGKSEFFNFPRLFRTAVDVARLWYELVIGREHLRPAVRVESAVAIRDRGDRA